MAGRVGIGRSLVGAAVWMFGLALVAATALPLLETNAWWVRIFDFPRAQVAALLALAVPATLLLLDRRRGATWGLLAALLVALGLQVQRIWPYTPLHPVQAATAEGCRPDDRLSVVVANLLESNSGAGPFLDAVRRRSPDVVFVVEVDQRWASALQPLEGDYAHRVVHPRDDAWGLALYSRLPLVEPQVRFLLSEYVPSVRTGVRLPSGAVVEFHGLHPKPPTPRHGTAQRDAELLLAARAAREGGAAIVGGDLNDVAWSDTTRLFQRIGGLLDPREGRGLFTTYHAELPAPLRWPIDHIFFTPAFRPLAVERLPHVGSDHFPLMVRLCHLPGAAQAPRPPQPTQADLDRAEELIRAGREEERLRPPGPPA